MRHALTVFAILATFATTAVAENMIVVQPTYVDVSRTYKDERGSDTTYGYWIDGGWGLTATGYVDNIIGDGGILASVGFYLPTGVLLGDRQASVIAADVGVGWDMSMPESSFTLIAGPAMSFNMHHQEVDEEDFTSSVFGIGALVIPTWAFSNTVSLAGTLKVAYEFLDLGHDPEPVKDVDYARGFSFAYGMGIAIRL